MTSAMINDKYHDNKDYYNKRYDKWQISW